MTNNDKLTDYLLTDIHHLKIHGRTTAERSPLTLFWTGSSLELNVRGSELWVEVEADYKVFEPWISIVINGVQVSRQMITEGRHWICVFRRMNPANVKHVQIVKDTQAMAGDPRCTLQIHAVRCDGEFLPIEDKPYKMEFIGDSITSGEGAVGARGEQDWIPMFFSSIDNYTAMTATACNAEYRVLSQAGWGALTGWDNNPHMNMPAGYEKVCGLLAGVKNRALGALEPHDFTAWQPDVVVVNLGTNDEGAFYQPAWSDKKSGKSFKHRLNEDGTFNEEDLVKFEDAVQSFLVKIRANNPKAHIVWAYGMMGAALMPAIQRAVNEYRQASGDSNVAALQLPDTTDEAIGARNHPGKLSHERAARVLSAYIQEVLT